MFCFHRWKEIKREYNPPLWDKFKTTSGGNYIPEAILNAVVGYTNIEMECEKCKDKKIVHTQGNV